MVNAFGYCTASQKLWAFCAMSITACPWWLQGCLGAWLLSWDALKATNSWKLYPQVNEWPYPALHGSDGSPVLGTFWHSAFHCLVGELI